MNQTPHHPDDLNIIGFLKDLWRGKWFLLCGLVLGLAMAIGVIGTAIPRYESQMMIGPAQSLQIPAQRELSGSNNNGQITSSDHGIAAEQAFTQFEAIYTGPSVAALLLRDKRIIDGLAKDQAFRFSKAKKEWRAADLATYLRKRVWVDPFGETTLRSLRYRHQDPQFAAYFVQQIHRTADQLIRADIRGGVDERIAYLERAMAKTLNPEHRRAITGLLLEQERTRMIVSMDEPVAAKIIEKSSASAKPVWPDRALFMAGFGIIGLFLGYIIFGLTQANTQQATKPQNQEQAPKRKRPLKYGKWFQDGQSHNNNEPGPLTSKPAHQKDIPNAAE